MNLRGVSCSVFIFRNKLAEEIRWACQPMEMISGLMFVPLSLSLFLCVRVCVCAFVREKTQSNTFSRDDCRIFS